MAMMSQLDKDRAAASAEKAFRKRGFQSRAGTGFGGHLRVDPVPAPMLGGAPKAVREASKALDDALRQVSEAESEQLNASVAVGQAQERDAAAVKEAVAAGKKIPKATLPAAVEREQDAAATVVARDALVKDAREALALAVFDHRDDWLVAIDQRDDDLARDIRGHADALEPALIEMISLAQLRREVEFMKPSMDPMFKPVVPKLGREARARLDGLSETLMGVVGG